MISSATFWPGGSVESGLIGFCVHESPGFAKDLLDWIFDGGLRPEEVDEERPRNLE